MNGNSSTGIPSIYTTSNNDDTNRIDNDDEEYQPLTPRYYHSDVAGADQQQQQQQQQQEQPPPRPSNASAKTSSSLSTATASTSTSVKHRTLLQPYSFDDMGRASTYLQFFKTADTTTTRKRETDDNNNNKKMKTKNMAAEDHSQKENVSPIPVQQKEQQHDDDDVTVTSSSTNQMRGSIMEKDIRRRDSSKSSNSNSNSSNSDRYRISNSTTGTGNTSLFGESISTNRTTNSNSAAVNNTKGKGGPPTNSYHSHHNHHYGPSTATTAAATRTTEPISSLYRSPSPSTIDDDDDSNKDEGRIYDKKRTHRSNDRNDDDDDDDDMYSAWNDLPTTIPIKHGDDQSTTSTTATILVPWVMDLWYLMVYSIQAICTCLYNAQVRYQTHVRHKQQNRYDLSLLQQQHAIKCQQMKYPFSHQQQQQRQQQQYDDPNRTCENTDDDWNDMSSSALLLLQPSYDFVLILQPQAVYSFWSEQLDFRTELLGSHVVQYMEEQWSTHQTFNAMNYDCHRHRNKDSELYGSNFHHRKDDNKADDNDDDSKSFDYDDDSMIAILGQYPTDEYSGGGTDHIDSGSNTPIDTIIRDSCSPIVDDLFIDNDNDDNDDDIEANRQQVILHQSSNTIRNRRHGQPSSHQLNSQLTTTPPPPPTTQLTNGSRSTGNSSSSSNNGNDRPLYSTPQNLYRNNNTGKQNDKKLMSASSTHPYNRSTLLSPGLYSYLEKSVVSATGTIATTTTKSAHVSQLPQQHSYYFKKSLFERAIESPPLSIVEPSTARATAITTASTANDNTNNQNTPQTIRSVHYNGGITTPVQYTDSTNAGTSTIGLLGNLNLTPASSVYTTGVHTIHGTTAPKPPNTTTTTHYPRKFGNPNVSSSTTTTSLNLKPRMKKINQQISTMISPPVRSLLKLSSMMGSGPQAAQQHKQVSENQSLIKPLQSIKPTGEPNSRPTGLDESEQKYRNADPNSIEIEDIQNPVMARGIASRNSRTNGMYPFLQSLREGIVVRRHRPGQEATFCKIMSLDGGDTIILQTIPNNEAMAAFKVQRERFGTAHANNISSNGVVAQYWSFENDEERAVSSSTDDVPHNFTVPNHVAADVYRKRSVEREQNPVANSFTINNKTTWAKSIINKFSQVASQKVGNGRTRSIHISNVVTIHPGQKVDPRSENMSSIGTSTIRRSKSEYQSSLSFSVVLLSRQHGPPNTVVTKKEKEYQTIEEKIAETGNERKKMKEYMSQWYDGLGSEQQFRYLDFEAASESDYWFIIRGLLFLHRDALVGRYAKNRAAGIGTNGRSNIQEVAKDGSITTPTDNLWNRLHVDEFHEPHTVSWLERRVVEIRKLDKMYMKGFVAKDNAVPPPSDYFLGFRSPGTSIWSRLRQAGLETQRVYSLDPNRVMIKVRCPVDRLLDVAEVLRINVKLKDGSFAPFREDMIEEYDSMIDPLEDPASNLMSMHYHNQYLNFQFRSSIRQAIIDFIIGSRIRDSGAELGQTTDLGQKIQARVPLHMHDKLNAIFMSWFYFWRVENWSNGHDGRSLTHAPPQRAKDGETVILNDHKAPPPNDDVPNIFTRVFLGSMYQPLDSIEAYFGEKVAFYFTWLQHTAAHLVFLSIAGLLLFILQLSSGTIDHPLRPLFSIVVMIWTFIVLINWKKRANYMAFRWGTMNYKEQETTRPQFKGDYTQDEITGEWIVTYPKWKRWLKYCISFPLTILFTMGTLVLILWVHANRDLQLAKYFSSDSTSTGHTKIDFDEFAFSAIGRRAPIQAVELSKENLQSSQFWFLAILLPSMLGLFLPLLNFLLMRLSILLNDFENYRTESEYRTYLIIKVFSFRFVCYFATLYYYSVISIGDDTSSDGGQQSIDNGILRVATGVLVYTTVAQWWQNFVHVCFPLLIGQLRMNHRNQRLADELRALEVEEAEIYRLSKICFDDTLKERQIRLMNKRLLIDQAQDKVWIELLLPTHDSFPEYIQAVVQFIFVSCFSVVLPITPLIVLFNYLISMRLDAYKLCRGRRRPLAEKTGGIGVWEHVLHIVAVISVLTNCWLMGFTSSQFYWLKEHITDVGLFAVIVIWEHVMLLIKYVMTTSISSLPKTVRDAMKREQYELNKERNNLMQERRLQQQQILNDELMMMNTTADNFNGSNTGNVDFVPNHNNNKNHDMEIPGVLLPHQRQLSARLLKRRQYRTSHDSGSTTSSSTNTVSSSTRNLRLHNYHHHHQQQQHDGTRRPVCTTTTTTTPDSNGGTTTSTDGSFQ